MTTLSWLLAFWDASLQIFVLGLFFLFPVPLRLLEDFGDVYYLNGYNAEKRVGTIALCYISSIGDASNYSMCKRQKKVLD